MKYAPPVVLTFLLLLASASAGSRANLALNAGFEEVKKGADLPMAWSWFSSEDQSVGIENKISRSGERSVKLSAQRVPHAHVGLFQDLAVDPEKDYTFVAYVRNDEDDKLKQSAHGMIGIEWKDANGREIGRSTSSKWDRQLSRRRWERFRIKDKAPKGAVSGRFVIHMCDGDLGASGSFYVDDVEITSK